MKKKRLAVNDIFIADIISSINFKATNDGKLLTRNNKNGKGLLPNNKWREIGNIDRYGYLIYQPRVNGKKVRLKVHRIIYAMLCGELNPYLVVDHKNCIRSDNKPDNLELITWYENSKRRKKIENNA